jgi:hypothetical protein
LRYICMRDEIEQLFALDRKWIPMGQYCSFDFVNSFMFLPDNSGSYIMVSFWLVYELN